MRRRGAQKVDTAGRQIVGEVNQLVAGEEGFWAPRAEVTHTFTLSVEPACRAERRNHAETARLRVDRLAALLSFVELASKDEQEARLGGGGAMALGLQPKDLLEDVQDATEDACACMRRQAALLADLTFETAEDRHTRLEALAAAGISRKRAHLLTDRAFGTVRAVHRLNEMTSDERSEQNSDFVPQLLQVMFKVHQRLEASFQRLDQGIGNAEKRLPRAAVEAWRQDCSGADTCMICLLELEEGGQCIALPCSHKFHHDVPPAPRAPAPRAPRALVAPRPARLTCGALGMGPMPTFDARAGGRTGDASAGGAGSAPRTGSTGTRRAPTAGAISARRARRRMRALRRALKPRRRAGRAKVVRNRGSRPAGRLEARAAPGAPGQALRLAPRQRVRLKHGRRRARAAPALAGIKAFTSPARRARAALRRRCSRRPWERGACCAACRRGRAWSGAGSSPP